MVGKIKYSKMTLLKRPKNITLFIFRGKDVGAKVANRWPLAHLLFWSLHISGVTPTGATGALAPVIFGILFSKSQIQPQ